MVYGQEEEISVLDSQKRVMDNQQKLIKAIHKIQGMEIMKIQETRQIIVQVPALAVKMMTSLAAYGKSSHFHLN